MSHDGNRMSLTDHILIKKEYGYTSKIIQNIDDIDNVSDHVAVSIRLIYSLITKIYTNRVSKNNSKRLLLKISVII